MPTKVIVHAGYHKCGTTSLQDFLKANKSALKPCFDVYGKTDFLAAGAHARIYSQRPYRWRLWRFRRSLRRFLNSIEAAETIILTRETFSGGMSGHRRLTGRIMTGYFSPSKPLSGVIISELRRRFGPDTEIIFAYSTRQKESWIKSVHGHLLRSIRLKDDFTKFRARFPDLLSPQEEAAQMAQHLAPVKTVTFALEDYAKHPEGPAAGLLDYLGVPQSIRKMLKPAKRANSGQSGAARAEFLALNRSTKNKAALKRAKSDLSSRLEL